MYLKSSRKVFQQYLIGRKNYIHQSQNRIQKYFSQIVFLFLYSSYDTKLHFTWKFKSIILSVWRLKSNREKISVLEGLDVLFKFAMSTGLILRNKYCILFSEIPHVPVLWIFRALKIRPQIGFCQQIVCPQIGSCTVF